MSSSIDQRIVSLRFDNAQFEAGAKESLKTLGELKNSLNLDESSKKLKGFSVTPLLSGINGLANSFSALDIVAITAISNITSSLMDKLGGALNSTIGQIYSGGLKRATNLEQARFAMQGLLYDTDEAGNAIERYGITTQQVIDGPVLNSVRGTAYGLDEAAKAASNFIASGVTDLGNLETVLKSISGTAAQTGSSFSDIAHIYARVAGNNRLYAIDLQSFAARGVNAAAAIRDYLNKLDETVNYTESDIRDLVSDGAINLDLFANAMYDAFGENAFRANETYSGSLSNLNAALSRLGAKFESKKLENMRNIFVALIPLVDTLSEAMDPLINVITGFSTSVANFAIDKIGKIEGFIKKITSAPEGTHEVREALENFDELTKGMSKIDKIKYKRELEAKLVSSMERIQNVITNLVGGLKNIGSAIKTFLTPITTFIRNISGGLVPTIEKASEGFFNFTEYLKNGASSIISAIVNFKETSKYFKLLESVIGFAANSIQTFVRSASSFASIIFKAFGPIFTSVVSNVSKVLSPVADKLSEFFNLATQFVTSKLDFSKFTDSMLSAFNGIDLNLSTVEKKITAAKDKILSFFSSIVETVHKVLPDLTLKNVFGWLLDFKVSDILKTLTGIANPIGTFINTVDGIIEGTSLEESFSKIKESPKDLTKNLTGMLPVLSKAKTSMLGFKDSVVESANGINLSSKKFAALEKIKSLIEQIGQILTKIGNRIGEILSRVGNSISEFFSKFSVTNISSGVVAGSLGVIAYEVVRFASTIRKVPVDLAKSVESLCSSIATAFNSLSDTFSGIKTAAMLKSIKAFAIAILLTAAAFKILSTMDIETEVKPAIISLSTIVAELAIAFTWMSRFVDSANLKGLGSKLIAFSTAILIISASMKILSNIGEDELNRGISALERMTLCILVYAGMMSIINNEIGSSGGKSGAALVSMGISMLLMAKAVENLGSIDPKILDQGILSLGSILAFIAMYNYVAKSTTGVSNGAGLILMATSLYIFTGAIQLLGIMRPEVILQGITAITVLLTVIAVYLNAIKETKPIQTATGLLILSAALALLAGVVLVIANLPLDNLNPVAVASLVGGLLLLATALRIIGDKGSIKSSAAILIVSAALLVLANAFAILSLLPFGLLLANMLLVIGGLVLLGSISNLVVAAGLALKIVANAFLIFGVSLLSIAVAITLITPLMAAFTVGLIGSLNLLITGILEMKDRLILAMQAIIEIIFTAIKESIDLIVGVIVEFGIAVLEGMQELVSPIVELIKTILYAIIDAIVEFIPYIVDSFLKIITGILEAIANNISAIVQAGMQIVIEFINGISAKLPDLIDSGFKLIISFIDGLADAIRNNAERLGKAAWNLVTAIVEGLVKGFKALMKNPIKKVKEMGEGIKKGLKEKINSKSFSGFILDAISGLISGIGSMISKVLRSITEFGGKIVKNFKENLSIKKFLEFGKNIVQGVIDGLNNLTGKAVEKVKSLASDLWSGFKSFLGINSPSTKFMDSGKDIVLGLNDGLKDYSSATTTVTDMGKSLLEKAKEWLNPDKFKPVGDGVTTGIKDGMDSKAPSSKMADVANAVKGIATKDFKSEQFTKYGKNTTDGIKSGMNKNVPMNAMTDTATGIKSTAGSNLKLSDFNKYGSNTTTGIKSGMDKSVPVKAMNDTATDIKKKANTELTIQKFKEIGANVMAGLKKGIEENTEPTIKQMRASAKLVSDAAKEGFRERSPSKVFIEIGKFLMLGLGKGISDNENEPINTMKDAVKALNKSVEDSINADSDFTITPVLDLSKIQNGVSDMNGMLNNNAVANVSANVNGAITNLSFMSAFDKLSSLLGGMPDSLLNADEIYDAVREGASNAVFNVMLDGNRITSTVNERNNDALNTRLSFYGG